MDPSGKYLKYLKRILTKKYKIGRFKIPAFIRTMISNVTVQYPFNPGLLKHRKSVISQV